MIKKDESKIRLGPRKPYPEEFKKKIIAEYIESELTKREILNKYGIRGNSSIQTWMRKFGISDPFAERDYLGLLNQIRVTKKKPDPTELELENKALEKRIRDLENKLSEEQIRNEMLTRIIDVAETDLKLNIRKKSGTK